MICYEHDSVMKMNIWYRLALTDCYIIHRVDGKSEINLYEQHWHSENSFGKLNGLPTTICGISRFNKTTMSTTRTDMI